MKSELYDYQQKIVDSLSNKKATALFMGMGTGKTITSLALFERSGCKNILVICLKSKIEDWVEDLKYECNIDAIVPSRKKQGGSMVINFEMAWRLESLLEEIDSSYFIIIDESHMIKNPNSKIGKFSRRLRLRTPHKCILTGTPQSQGYIDYYNQMHFIDSILYPFSEFKRLYCVYHKIMINGYPQEILKGYKNVKEIDALINSCSVFFERNMKYPQIPSEITVNIKKSSKYNKILNDRVYNDILLDSIGAMRMAERQLSSGFLRQYDLQKENYKITWLKDLLLNEIPNDRVVIFYNFQHEKELIVNLMNSIGRNYSVYEGERASLSVFMNNDDAIAIVQYQSGSTGVNDFVLSNVFVAFSPTDNYILFQQSKKRIDRIGQTKTPLYYFLTTRGSVEEKIYEALSQGKNFDDKMYEKCLQM